MRCNGNSSWNFGEYRKARRAAALGLLGGLSLAACAPLPDEAPIARDEAPSAAEDESAPRPVPPGAIAVTPDLYMLPMGTDAEGCPQFQPWSPTMAVVQALHWRRSDGGFTLDREAADCP